MVGSDSLTFEKLLAQKSWGDYVHYVAESQEILEHEIKENVKNEKQFVKEIRESEEFRKLDIKNFDAERLNWASRNLKEGNVVGIDGTRSLYQLFSGVRCQIGVVAVNYVGERIEKSFFVSEALYREESGDVVKRIKERIESAEDVSDFALRGLMSYRERELGLEQKFAGRYKMFHGSLIPFELLTDLGRLKAFRINIALLQRLIDEKKCFSVVSQSNDKSLYYFGLAMDEGQYASIPSYNYGKLLANKKDFLVRGKWETKDWDLIQDFIKNYAERIKIGIIKVNKHRPYIFQAYEDIFDEAAHIVAADSMFQKEKGFPLLIDYADTLCSEYFSSSQFSKRMEWQLAKEDAFLTESSERGRRKKR